MRTEDISTRQFRTSMLDALPGALPQRVVLALVPPLFLVGAWGMWTSHLLATFTTLLLGGLFALSPRMVSLFGTASTGHVLAGAIVSTVVLPVALDDLPAGTLFGLAAVPFITASWLREREGLQWSGGAASIALLLALRFAALGQTTSALWAFSSLAVIASSAGLSLAFRDALRSASNGDTDPRQRSLEKEYQAVLEALETALGSSAKKDRFLSLMSFELRTPLTAIMGYSEMLAEVMEDVGEPEDVEDSRAIQRSSKRLLHVVDDILDLSQVGAGTLELRRAPVDLTAIVRLALDEVHANHPDIVLDTEIAQIGLIMGDYDRLGRIVTNLAEQVLKAAQPGEHVRVLLVGRIRAVSLVLESGPGRLEREDVQRLRDGLQQPVDEKPLHLGLELTVADSLLHTMLGELSIERGQRGQARFIATLPVEPAFGSEG